VNRLALLILLPLLGCRAIVTRDFVAVSVLTSPTIQHGKYVYRGADGEYRLIDLGGYVSKSEVTGSDIATFAAVLAKLFLAVP
jgi:hypothetical protein